MKKLISLHQIEIALRQLLDGSSVAKTCMCNLIGCRFPVDIIFLIGDCNSWLLPLNIVEQDKKDPCGQRNPCWNIHIISQNLIMKNENNTKTYLVKHL